MTDLDTSSVRPLAQGGGAELSPDPSAAHRLGYSIEPIRYDLRLVPDLEEGTFEGEVAIGLIVHEPTDTIVLHAAELSIKSAELMDGEGVVREATSRIDEDLERVAFSLGEPLIPGPQTITIEFSGILNDKLHGFYRSTYTDESSNRDDETTSDRPATRTLATTQFEATDARRAFPCFDEPDRKAVFSITLDIEENLEAVSNGPIIETTDLGGGKKRIVFGETIKMSTYLVAFVIGQLEATEPIDAGGVPVRVVHVPGKESLTAFALEVAKHALEFFTDWFGIEYPAEKLDLVAIPDFAFGAMENLGCVTFRETALLADPERASRLELERIADVVAHEIAHMWFGDLVTMKWWNGIWLNEAFATLMELLCVDAFRPEWGRWTSFGVEREVAMATDGLHATRPVEYPVGPPEEAQGMFDVLTYQKGASVLRMLERYLGPDRFREGIRKYLADHRFSNTETSDLFNAIEEASGEPVRAIMDTWILQGGFPLVTVEPDESGLVVSQDPFEYAPSPQGDSSIGSVWSIPILTRRVNDSGGTSRVLLGDTPVHIDVRTDDDPVVVNAGSSGFYPGPIPGRPPSKVGRVLGDLVELERFTLLGDTWAAVVGDRVAVDDFFLLAEAIRGREGDPDVWSEVTGGLSFLDHSIPEFDREALAEYTRALLRPAFDSLGWKSREGEAERTRTLRSLLLGSLGTYGKDPEIIEWCSTTHAEAASGGPPIDPDLASSVVSTVAASGGKDEFEIFLDLYQHPSTPQERVRYLYSLAGFKDPELSERVFSMAMGEVRTQDAPFLIQLLLANRSSGEATWKKVTDNWEEIVSKFPTNILPRMLDGVKVICWDPGLSDEIRGFLATNRLPIGQKTVDQATERLGVNTAFAIRLASTVAGELEAGIERLSP